MAPTFPCPRSHSALVHSSRQTDGGPSSCTSFPSARTSLARHLHTLLRALALFLTPVYLSVSPSSDPFSLFLYSGESRALGLVPSFYVCIFLYLAAAVVPLLPLHALSLSHTHAPHSLLISLSPPLARAHTHTHTLSRSLSLSLAPSCVRTILLSSSLFTTIHAPRAPASAV